jgi:FKBP-type peptidyl-prolyl cis-trans isomerase
VPTNKQRREAQRRHLERQLERRRDREIARRKTTLVMSIVGTLVLIAVVILTVVFIGHRDNTTKAATDASTSSTPTPSPTSPVSTSPAPTPTTYPAATGPAVSFDGVTVKGATDLKGYPGVTSKSSTVASKLMVKDLVVGKGAAATPTSKVTVQYYGVLYSNGKYFDSSWKRGTPAQFSLAKVVPGFTQGIGGTTGVAPMKVGGRRIIIVPAALGYGAQGSPPTIPANASLVFIVDLKSVDS